MTITKFSINHFMAVLVMCAGILLAGSSFYSDMPRENFPDVKIPYVIVTTTMTGANPTDVEISITTPLESELEGIEGLKKLNSTSSEGVSVISLEFDPSLETEIALSRVRDAVDKGKANIPTTVDAPIVKEFSLSGETPVVVLSLLGSKNISLSQLQELGEKIEDAIERIPAVLDVKLRGGRDRMILIEVDPERMRYYNISLGQIQQILISTNQNVSAGASEGRTNRIVMRAPSEFQTTGEIFNLVIGTSDRGTPVYMRDIATVNYSFENEKSRARHYNFTGSDGESSVNQYVKPDKSISIEVMKKSGENLLALTDAVKKTIIALNLPEDVNIIVSLDQSKEVKMMLSDLENGIGTSLILVLLVIFIGLGARNAILVAVAIPFSMFLSIICLSTIGFTLNMMVLYSLIMALGMLVDNAIVIVENIYRHYCLGETRINAAFIGTTEVAWPVIASTATTVGAFLPLVFWPGIMGSFMSFLPKTVIIVLISSLFVALVINPTLCSLLMKRGQETEKFNDSESIKPTYPLVALYGRLLNFMLIRPLWTISSAVLILVFSIVLYSTFGSGVEFFPTLDPSSINVNIKPPEGVSLDESDRLSKQMEDRVFGRPGSGFNAPVKNIKNASVTIPLGGQLKTLIQFVDRDYRDGKTSTSVSEIRNRIEGLDAEGKRVTFPLYDAEYDVVTPSDGPSSGKPISVDIYGEDLNQMTDVIKDMKKLMTETEGVAKPSDDAATAQPTLEWRIDRTRAGMFGLNQSTVASYLQLAVGGVRSGTFGHGDDEQDILFRAPQFLEQSATQLKNITIPTPGGGSIPITSIASATLVPGPISIKHGDRKRVLNAGAEIQPWVRADADVRASFQEKVKKYAFPPGITYSFGGAAEDQKESTEFLTFAFVLALFIMGIVLVVQFNSIFVPLIIFASIILSLIGVFAGLLIFDMPFGIIMSGIGVISLAGVVVNNAIVLLDAIKQMQEKGHELYDAVISAGMIRFRPVLLTAITTILGLAPMAFKINIDFANLTYQYDTDSSQYWQSMAVAIIFGLLLSTLLTLGVVPTLYVIYFKGKSWVSEKLSGNETVN
ncbi:MAG: efflux RND transporter permease subunit [Deltaproteobacteria bacterium]|nr:efflux RND transporter permease subunit [Deltaproteobacteria bacterium]